METLKVGDQVKWESQACGYYRDRVGKVVRVLKEKEVPINVAKTEFPNYRRMFDGHRLPIGAKKAYLIEVTAGPKAKKRLYMPYPSKIKKSTI